jgi:hypothetical protein
VHRSLRAHGLATAGAVPHKPSLPSPSLR